MKRRYVWVALTFVLVLVVHATYTVWHAAQIAEQWALSVPPHFLRDYFLRGYVFLGLSYSLAGAFTVYAWQTLRERRRSAVGGVLGGLTLSAVLYAGSCFLLGCCGSPMLPLYLSLFGSSFLGVTKPLTFGLTAASIGFGVFMLHRRGAHAVCDENCGCHDVGVKMESSDAIRKIYAELEEGMAQMKCHRCGCMKEALDALPQAIIGLDLVETARLREELPLWAGNMDPIKYSCLGCEHCYPAVALNALHEAYPETAQAASLSCEFEVDENAWPAVPGEYFAKCEGAECPVAVSTLASVELAERLWARSPRELCIIGKTETENIGIDKLIKNVITNPTIRVLVVAGKDPAGHLTGQTLLAVAENGVDHEMRVIGSPGKRPFLKNVMPEEVSAFRSQVKVVNLIGCEDEDVILAEIAKQAQAVVDSCACESCASLPASLSSREVPVVSAKEPTKIEMDRAGYFVILPQPEKRMIIVEHYDYQNNLLRVIEGENARSLYWTILQNGWVTQLSHAAYLGKELERAWLSMQHGLRFVQDGAYRGTTEDYA